MTDKALLRRQPRKVKCLHQIHFLFNFFVFSLPCFIIIFLPTSLLCTYFLEGFSLVFGDVCRVEKKREFMENTTEIWEGQCRNLVPHYNSRLARCSGQHHKTFSLMLIATGLVPVKTSPRYSGSTCRL